MLGAYMLAPLKVRASTGALVATEDFYVPAHRLIHAAALEVLDDHPEDGDPGDAMPVLVADRLKARGDLTKVGGPAKLVELQGSCPSTTGAPRFARIVANAARLRELEAIGTEVATLARREPDATVATTTATQLLRRVVVKNNAAMDLLTMEAMLTEHADVMDERSEGRSLGLRTGWDQLDNILGGMRGGEFIVAAGRPAMGKSIFAGNISLEAAALGYQVLYVSLEMSRVNLLDRWVASVAHVHLKRLRLGQLRGDDHLRVSNAYARLMAAPLDILADPMATMEKVQSAVHRVNTQGRPLLIVLDYIQLMKNAGGRGRRQAENRQVEVAEISGACKRLALETNGVVLGLSQFSRALESRMDKRPILSDLRESGALEQDADVVLGLYRDDMYNPESAARGNVDIIVLKSRNTELGTATLAFLGHHGRIANIARTDARMAGESERPAPRDITEPTPREDVA